MSNHSLAFLEIMTPECFQQDCLLLSALPHVTNILKGLVHETNTFVFYNCVSTFRHDFLDALLDRKIKIKFLLMLTSVKKYLLNLNV